MVTIKGKNYLGIWYDLEVGYYTLWDNRWLHDDYFMADPEFDIPWDKNKECCVLYPNTPDNLYEKTFSPGDLPEL
jgi:hypothetical protein